MNRFLIAVFGNYLQAQDPNTMRKVDDSDDWAEFYRDAKITTSVITFSNVNHVRTSMAQDAKPKE